MVVGKYNTPQVFTAQVLQFCVSERTCHSRQSPFSTQLHCDLKTPAEREGTVMEGRRQGEGEVYLEGGPHPVAVLPSIGEGAGATEGLKMLLFARAFKIIRQIILEYLPPSALTSAFQPSPVA